MKLLGQRQYPKSVQVGDQEYVIKWVRRVPGEEPNVVGKCDPGDHVIYMRLRQSRRECLATFIHEVLHAFEFEHRIDLPHRTVYALEKAIMGFLELNT